MLNFRSIPNILTLFRIVLAFMLLFVVLHSNLLFLQNNLNYCATFIFCLASLTDFFDGYIARKFSFISTFGEIFDPLADKLLILSAFIGLLILDRVDPWSVFLILSREFFVTGLRVVAVSNGINVAASNLGKYKTASQIIAIIALFMDFDYAIFILWFAVFITIYSGYDYLRSYLTFK